MRPVSILPILLAILALGLAPPPQELAPVLHPGSGVPTGWRHVTFPKVGGNTRYSVVLQEGTPVMRAEASDAGSMIVWEQEFDPRQHSVLEWDWRVDGPLAGANLWEKSGDDAPARVIVMFPENPDADRSGESWRRRLLRLFYGDDLPSHAMGYVGAAEDGSWMRSAFTWRVRLLPMAVLPRGDAPAPWQHFQRNLVADYAEAFGGEPPSRALLGIMVDTDNTHQHAVSEFRGLRLLQP